MQKRIPLSANHATEHDRQLIRDELARVIQSAHFVGSKRYPAFLSYVVEQTLSGNAQSLKERTLGVEVFHRKPDYDTHSDTVVRFTAGEVRKRLVTVYHESSPDRAIRIELPVGSYVPEFFQVADGPSPDIALSEEAPHPLSDPVPPAEEELLKPAHTRSLWYATFALVLLVSLAWVAATQWWSSKQDALAHFWQPVAAAPGPIILSPGAIVFSAQAGDSVTNAQKTDPYPFISMATARALSDLVAMFSKSKTAYDIRPTSEISLTELREHPVVLIGAYNSDWTLRLANGLRYRFTDKPTMEIYDATNPAVRWARPPQIAYAEADDYAVVARFRDKLTDNFVVLIAGIGKNGTEAAAQFVTSEKYLKLLGAAQFKDLSQKNIECVLKTKVIDGKAGPPSLEAVDVW